MNGRQLFNFKAVKATEVPPSKRKIIGLLSHSQEEWARLTQAISSSNLKDGEVLKVNVTPEARKLKGIKYPERILLRSIRAFVEDQKLKLKAFLRNGEVYIAPQNVVSLRRAA